MKKPKKMKGGNEYMENINLKTGSLFLMGLLLVSIVAPLTAAASLREQDAAARERYAQARSDFTTMRSEYEGARRDYMNARQMYGARDRATLDSAKNYLLKANEATISHLSRIKAFIESDWAMSTDEKNRIVSEIESKISWLEGKQAEIEAANSREDLVAIGRDIRDYWQDTRVFIKKDVIAPILNARAQWVLSEAQTAEDKVSDAIQMGKDAGKDVSAAEDLLADYMDKRAMAEAEYEKAKNSFQSISSLSDADALFREGNAFIKQGNVYIRQAYSSLKEAYRIAVRS